MTQDKILGPIVLVLADNREAGDTGFMKSSPLCVEESSEQGAFEASLPLGPSHRVVGQLE